jgi:hypothetical protein
VGEDGFRVLLSLLLLIMAATVPIRPKGIQPLSMVAQERSEQNQEEEI